MSGNLNHIISKCQWDTSFDRKDMAFELQERLSSWSRFTMPTEAGDVFNKVCPPDQTWRIPSLEIDLGNIDFGNLEFELSSRLYRQLNEKLLDLIFYTSRSGGDIEILNEDTSHVQMVRSFLLNGVMPWGYKPVDGTLNQMLYHQLQNNRQQVIMMLREVGVTHLNVRKRMAWQINEINIIKIIEALEPNNHTQIIEFSNQFTRIQAEETIVQTNIADFKKNIWLWVFNFLFTERGTVFNKIAFMKSSIRQMADHYDIGYDELFLAIERAVDEVSQRYNVKADFLLTLKALSKENRVLRSSGKRREDKADFWVLLERHFKDPPAPGLSAGRLEFNELVDGLYRQNRARFTGLINSLGYSEVLWLTAVSRLTDFSLEVVLSALDATKADTLVQSIYLLEKLGRGMNLHIERKVLWLTGIKFLYSHKNSSYNSSMFLRYGIAELAKRSGLSKLHILDRLTSADIPFEAKTMVALEVYNSLTAVFISEIFQKNSTVSVNQFKEIIDALSGQLVSGLNDKELFVSLQKLFKKNLRINPKIALEALITYPNKEQTEQLLPYMLDSHTIQLLLSKADKEKQSVIFSVQRILAEQAGHKKGGGLAFLSASVIAELGLKAIILHPGLHHETLLEFILEGLSVELTGSQLEKFERFAEVVSGDNELRSLGISEAFSGKLYERFFKETQLSPIELVNNLVSRPGSKKAETARIIKDNFTDKAIVELIKPSNKDRKAVLNFLMNGGEQLMESLVREYKTLIRKRSKQFPGNRLDFILREVYWKCILNYKDHHGNSEALKRSFKTAVLFKFPAPASRVTTADRENYLLNTGGKGFQLKSGGQISEGELMELIEKCLSSATATVTYDNVKINISELLYAALEAWPAKLRNIISRTPVTSKLVAILNEAIPIEHFGLWIANDISNSISEAVRSISTLHDLFGRIGQRVISNELSIAYWTALLTAIKTGSSTSDTLEKLIRESVSYVFKENQIAVNSETISAAIKKMPAGITPALKRALISYIPALSGLREDRSITTITSKLLRAERKGLLDELIHDVISRRQIPGWFGAADGQEIEELLNEIVIRYPVKFFLVLKQEVVSEAQMQWVSEAVSFKMLAASIGALNPTKRVLLNIYEEFYASLGRISIAGISSGEIQHLLFRKVIKAWTTGNWKIISTDNIWNELVWDMSIKRGISKQYLVKSIEKNMLQFPLSLQVSFKYLSVQLSAPAATREKEFNLKQLLPVLQKKGNAAVIKESIAIRNAGLVLISNYIPVLFERLELTVDKVFKSETSQHDAIHYLQYIVTGSNNTDESLLALNKVLCGLPLSAPVKDGIAIPAAQQELIDDLINAVIGHWPTIGESSVDGFRGNWLVREGLLIEHDDKWELIVEKRAYDLLINKSPFSFSIIKYQWMNKPLHVTWPY